MARKEITLTTLIFMLVGAFSIFFLTQNRLPEVERFILTIVGGWLGLFIFNIVFN